MEILIVGLILVGLMVYASTRIKRTAAEAFEPETVESDDFTIEKPDGFLYVLNGDPSLSFEAYSREMGEGDAGRFRAARAELRTYEKRTLNYASTAIKGSTKIDSELSEVINGQKYRVMEGTSEEKGVGFREIYKLAEKLGRVFEFKLLIVEDTDADVSRKAEAMLGSFTVK